MLAAQPGKYNIMAISCPDTIDLIGSDCHTNTGTADKYAPVKFAAGNSCGNCFCQVRVIYGVRRKYAYILYFKFCFFDILQGKHDLSTTSVRIGRMKITTCVSLCKGF